MTMVKKTMENAEKCLCMKCPSYTKECLTQTKAHMPTPEQLPKLTEFEDLYCSFGKSLCFSEEHGCVCGDCQVHKENGLKMGYFCTRDMKM